MVARPNICYIHSHDTGRYVQPYGYAVPTPSLQQLAEQGVLFRRAFCAAPTCSPSRAALLTGRYAHEVGMLGLAHRGFRLHGYSQHLANVLGGAGYRTALVGVQHVARDESEIGYHDVVPVASRHVADVAPAAARYLADTGPEPFFLDVGFFETHRPFPEPSTVDDSRYCQPPVPLPDTPETRADMAAYKASVRTLDTGIGTVLESLERAGLADNTLVICTTDHGLAFPHMKCHLTDHGIGVMLIMRGPQGFHGGRIVDAMVSHLDIMPTICDVAGIDRPVWLQGSSLAPVVNGRTDVVHDAVFAEVTYHAAYEPQRCVRTDRWKYIRRFDDRQFPVGPNTDVGPSKRLLEAQGWRDQERPQEMLFDLIFDPQEARNLAGMDSHHEVLDDMRKRLDAWMHETDDPLRYGPVPAGPRIRLDDPDTRDPGGTPGGHPGGSRDESPTAGG